MTGRVEFAPEQVAMMRRTIEIVERAHADLPYHESVTAWDIRGHTLLPGDITMSYKDNYGPAMTLDEWTAYTARLSSRFSESEAV